MSFVITLWFPVKGKPSLTGSRTIRSKYSNAADLRFTIFGLRRTVLAIFGTCSNGNLPSRWNPNGLNFKSDEEWQSVKAETEKDGPIVENINVIVLKRLA